MQSSMCVDCLWIEDDSKTRVSSAIAQPLIHALLSIHDFVIPLMLLRYSALSGPLCLSDALSAWERKIAEGVWRAKGTFVTIS